MKRHILALMLLALPLGACSSWFESSQPYLQTKTNLIPGEKVVSNDKTTAYALARKYNVPMNDIIVLNRLRRPYVVWPGQEVTLPAGHDGGMSRYAARSAPSGYKIPQSADRYAENTRMQDNYVPSLARSEKVEASELPPLDRSGQDYRPLDRLSQDETVQLPEDMAPEERFLWPVEGPVLMAFGPRNSGGGNDGINIAAPRGTPVNVAANGVVVHADRQGAYGNLILVRHGSGFVTAYAHLDRIIVEKDMVVAKGDMIGTVGSSGKIKGPQLHFQIRLSGKPVDPERYLPPRPEVNPY